MATYGSKYRPQSLSIRHLCVLAWICSKPPVTYGHCAYGTTALLWEAFSMAGSHGEGGGAGGAFSPPLFEGEKVWKFVTILWCSILFVPRYDTVRQNEINFISHANHHAHIHVPLMFCVHAESVRRSRTNEMDNFKESKFPVVPAAPHQPDEFAFPSRLRNLNAFISGTLVQGIQVLHYDEAKDVVFCHICVTAIQQKKLKGTNAEPSFARWFDPI